MITFEALKHNLNALNQEHRALDDAIARMMKESVYDQLAVQRLKKQKLYLKDKILTLKMKMIPDIIA